ncbi:rho-related BTB domain-containing protein 1 [Nematostella vectensis]|uniref:rho-related BTB domain-containing protein 1 n=1 Tax=Nematostella vectensis TaxID=45351 RepID=UPI00138FB662|nr:rho-related BTB domain-containing protein 1 [Nematostella vectensis]
MNELDFDEEHQRELIKCVVVGNSGVGKTRLICAEALGVGMKTQEANPRHVRHVHYPTVFAIDQYHVSAEIRDRANFTIDGVSVSLRLWDTFGDHSMNRRFAYQNAHVIVLCFAINTPSSFKDVNAVWYPEIKKYCPRVPIILVGTKSDWRSQLNVSVVCQNTSLSKRMRECFLVSPDMGRQVAKEIDAVYYEASVVDMWGYHDVFENAIRAALNSRRQTRFWSSHLKRVSQPRLQPPNLPPKPTLPNIIVPSSLFRENLKTIFHSSLCSDVVFLIGNQSIPAHAMLLAAMSPTFAHLLLGHELFGELIEEEKLQKFLVMGDKSVTSFQEGDVMGEKAWLPRGFTSINLSGMQCVPTPGNKKHQLLVKLDTFISHSAFLLVLDFLYSGNLSVSACTKELQDAALYLQLANLASYVENVINNMAYMNTEVYADINMRVTSCARAFVGKECMSDVAFDLGVVVVHAHKVMLVSQSEMLAAMFMEGHFLEGGRQSVRLRDTNHDHFLALLEFLYTGRCPNLFLDDALGVIALANFFCLPRLVASCEQLVVKELQASMHSDELAVSESVIVSMIEAELHNASQLQQWCRTYISCNYNALCRKHPKELKALNPDTQKHLEQHRWPPVWYILENDWYEKEKREQESRASKTAYSVDLKAKRKRCHCL